MMHNFSLPRSLFQSLGMVRLALRPLALQEASPISLARSDPRGHRHLKLWQEAGEENEKVKTTLGVQLVYSLQKGQCQNSSLGRGMDGAAFFHPQPSPASISTFC